MPELLCLQFTVISECSVMLLLSQPAQYVSMCVSTGFVEALVSNLGQGGSLLELYNCGEFGLCLFFYGGGRDLIRACSVVS